MSNKFNLSEKIWSSHEIKVKLADDVISVSNVKDFIRILKAEIQSKPYVDDCIPKEALILWIDKLAGEKLI